MNANRLVALGTVLLLAGCVTAEEQRSMDENECRSYGFKAGRDAFADCLLKLELDRRAARRASAARLDDWDRWDRPVVIYRQLPPPAPKPQG